MTCALVEAFGRQTKRGFIFFFDYTAVKLRNPKRPKQGTSGLEIKRVVMADIEKLASTYVLLDPPFSPHNSVLPRLRLANLPQ